MTRRGLIRRLLLIFTIVPWRWAGRQGLEAAQLVPRPVEAPTEPLSALDLDDLVAFGEIVVGPGALSPLERGYLVDHIGYQARRASGYYLSAYRTTVSLLARLAGGRFAQLDTDQRYALVTRHRLNAQRVWPDEDLGPFPDDARLVRARVVADLISGYYASPAGWAIVGYDGYPGRCGDLARYTVPPPRG